MIDNYRVNLFKRKLREILGLQNVRFYWSVGKCHLIPDLDCFVAWHKDTKFISDMMHRLKREGIEFVVLRDRFGIQKRFGHEPQIDALLIPIDQPALPERKRRFQTTNDDAGVRK